MSIHPGELVSQTSIEHKIGLDSATLLRPEVS